MAEDAGEAGADGMSLKRWNARRDSTEPDILEALRRVGAEVIRLDAFDLLVLHRGRLHMLDCKSEGGKVTAGQRRLLARGWPLKFAETPDEALKVIGVILNG